MKSPHLTARTLLLAATFVTAALAADDTRQSDSVIPFTGRPHIERGMNRETVRAMFGAPSALLSADVWVYFDFQAGRQIERRINVAKPENRDTLVVGFTKDRVALIQLCDSKPVRAFLAQQDKGKVPASSLAAK